MNCGRGIDEAMLERVSERLGKCGGDRAMHIYNDFLLWPHEKCMGTSLYKSRLSTLLFRAWTKSICCHQPRKASSYPGTQAVQLLPYPGT